MAARRAGAAALALSLLAAAGAQGRTTGPTLTGQPTVAGTAKAGSRLAAGTGTWTSAARISYAYQWYRCDASGARCTSIHGATAPGLMLTDKDIGNTVGLTVTAADAAGATSAYASLVGPIAGRKPLLVSTAQPLVAGVAVEGKPVQVTTGAWSPSPTSVIYSWRRCNANGRVCAPIPHARDGAYTVAAADVGHALVALVEATFGGMRQSALSTATSPVIGDDIAGPTHSALPSISGLPVSGTQLSGSVGVWRGVGTLAYRYQWYRCDSAGARCLSIHGATAATYRAVRADDGKTLGFAVRATDSTGSAAAYSTLFGPIAPPQPPITPVAPPVVTGSPHPGSTLAVDTGRWEPNPDALGYEWRRCNANGRICAPIEGGTEPSYTVTTADVGHTLVAVVSARAGTATWSTYGSTTQLVR